MDANAASDFYRRVETLHLHPGWRGDRPDNGLAMHEFKPALWRWSDARPALDEAARVVSTEQAERRNLALLNRSSGVTLPAAKNFVAAYQMVLAGEKARSHRHAAAALRLVVDTKPGVYTIVNGERLDMLPGDVVLTPAFCWHGHANDSEASAYWIDFLDVPFVAANHAMTFEPYPEPIEPVRRADPASPYRIPPAKVFNRERTSGVVEIARGIMPTIGLYLIRHQAGARMELSNSVVGNLYSPTSGRARFIVDGVMDETIGPGDILSVPARHAHRMEALEADTTVLRVSDEPLLARLGLFHSAALN
ncbi:MAG TPA: cupin domain-containing protein [Candidatus Binataceae bacterium]|nr:cupin domain-containing protein [Candidatus Binataceae bacterium]